MSKKTESAKELSFEESLARLESIVQAIEEGKIGLEQSIAEYEKGMKLIHRCRSILANAETRIQQLQRAEDGSLTPSPMTDVPPDQHS